MIEITNLNYKYKNGEKIINDINLNIKNGEIISIIREKWFGKIYFRKVTCWSCNAKRWNG